MMPDLFAALFILGVGFGPLPTDCSDRGQHKILISDNGAGVSWLQTNDVRWCDPLNISVNPVDDPVFQSED